MISAELRVNELAQMPLIPEAKFGNDPLFIQSNPAGLIQKYLTPQLSGKLILD